MGNSYGWEETAFTDGSPPDGGTHKNGPGNKLDAAGQLVKFGRYSSKEVNMEQYLVYGRADEVSIWCFALTNKLRNMRYKRNPNCKPWDKPVNVEHILSSCSVTLADGRYTWRQNKVISVLANALEKNRKKPEKGKRVWNLSHLSEKESRLRKAVCKEVG